ncbi:hypothetical protein [Halorussus salinisoli]|uniref:hypothetical protein n=1 Tax=Halorussus salinisoli TaxID=2558242 RepID=UPI0010C16EC0|nr:hypothetical protein [Halorussus salinisoli]
MNEPSSERVGLAIARLQNGLRPADGRGSQTRAIQLADRIAETELDPSLLAQYDSASEFKAEQVEPTVDTVRRLRKLTELVEDDFGVDVGHSRFTKVATGLAKLSSLGSVVISGHNLVLAAGDLRQRYRVVGTPEKIKEQQYTTFYEALGIFVIDCMLFTTPLNYRTAWLGTRFINNRFLYRLRGVSKPLHRYAMSEFHYVIRDILPRLLHGAVHYSDYLLSVTVGTFEQLWEFGSDDIPITKIPSTVERLVDEFHQFATTNYAIEPPDLDWNTLYADILSEVKDITDVSLWSVDEMIADIEAV